MKTLLNKCKALAISYWITSNNNWCFKAKDTSITNDDLDEIRSIAAKNGLDVKLFPASSKFNSETGEKELSDAQFVIMPPKTTSDDEMLNAF
tara:strand:+ start:181 stop:456 length:276 start_codon:yes stop_codon:yes gene_type:complete